MYERLTTVAFPNPRDIKVNMMPILLGDVESIPEELRGYAPLVDACIAPFRVDLERQTIYLSIHESHVEEGQTQRRADLHTEGALGLQSDGRHLWGGSLRCEGLYVASSDGGCRIWNTETLEVDHFDAVAEELDAPSEILAPNTLYWLTDRTPHEVLPATRPGCRQWFRLVLGEVSAWWAQHNTANRLGVLPKAPVRHGNKFAKSRA